MDMGDPAEGDQKSQRGSREYGGDTWQLRAAPSLLNKMELMLPPSLRDRCILKFRSSRDASLVQTVLCFILTKVKAHLTLHCCLTN